MVCPLIIIVSDIYVEVINRCVTDPHMLLIEHLSYKTYLMSWRKTNKTLEGGF